jgi:hypothetical protein
MVKSWLIILACRLSLILSEITSISSIIHVAGVCSKSSLSLYAPSLKQQVAVIDGFTDEYVTKFFSRISSAEEAIQNPTKKSTLAKSNIAKPRD